MTFRCHSHLVQHGQPDIAERRVFRRHNVVPKLEPRPTSSEQGRTVIEVVFRPDITPVS